MAGCAGRKAGSARVSPRGAIERLLRQQSATVDHWALQAADYSLQANRKTREGKQHPDRNAQFEHIAAKTRAFLRRRQTVISVDTKKKELVGDFKNGGTRVAPDRSARGRARA